MIEKLLDILTNFSYLDLIFLIFLIINSIIALRNGFVLSLLSFMKWILSIICIKLLLPKITPYTGNIIKSEFMHDIILGSVIFIFSIFFIILVSKGLTKTMSWTGLGNIDKFFGFLFGFLKGYVYFVLIFSLINFIHPYNRWSISYNSGKFFDSILWGNSFLEENLPKRHEYIEKSKKNIDKLNK